MDEQYNNEEKEGYTDNSFANDTKMVTWYGGTRWKMI
jgi:hypothetical protein